jgi:hypothetical protein
LDICLGYSIEEKPNYYCLRHRPLSIRVR